MQFFIKVNQKYIPNLSIPNSQLHIHRFDDAINAIYQNKLSKAYFYYVKQDNGFEGWVAGPDKGNDNTHVMKMSHK